MTEKWYDSDDPNRVARGAAWFSLRWVVTAILVIGVIGIAIWGFRVLTSDAKGQGDAIIKKNEANNRIAAQERFEVLYADIKATDMKIDVWAAQVKASPNDKTAATNYASTITYCLSLRGEYDAEARKFTSEDFRAIDLPAQIDIYNPNTDCKETQQ